MDTFQNLANQFDQAIFAMKGNMPLVLRLIGALYAIHFLNCILGYRLNLLGIYPRKWFGLCGIFFSPFLHGNFNHLFFNSIPLFTLLCFVLLYGINTFLCVSALIMLIGGLGTWLFGRRGIHIGASGLIMGYWGYLLFYAYQQPSAISIALAGICLYYFGGLLFNLFPLEVKSSWEAHFFGFLAGLVAAVACPYISW
jgi:membrane associated rhomboid family serine protease